MTIIMDSNEALEAPAIKQKILERGIRVEVRHLEVGDYIIGKLCIERKDIDDFIASVHEKNNRYWNQLYNMKLNFDRRILYVVGQYPRRVPKYRNRAFNLHDFMVWVSCTSYYSYQVPVIHVYTVDEFIDHLVCYHNRYGKLGTTLRPLRAKKVKRTTFQICSDIYSMFPGIGRRAADELARQYSLYKFFNLGKKEMAMVRVGKRRLGVKGERMYDIIHYVHKLKEE